MEDKRVIAFIDVLGFSRLVTRENFGERFDSYIDTIKTITKEVSPDIEYVVFSDSIVILAKGHEEDDLLNISKVVSAISYDFLVNQKLPIKGCIACGKINFNKTGTDVVIAGTPIIEAYHYEQKQDWVGVLISPSVIRDFPNIANYILVDSCAVPSDKAEAIKSKLDWNLTIQRSNQVRFKGSDSNFEGYCIVPHELSCTEKDILVNLERYKEILNEQMMCAPEPKDQMKYRATNSFIQINIQNFRRVVDALNR